MSGTVNFAAPLATALAAAEAQSASLWDLGRARTVREALQARASQGPLTARDATAFASLLPTYVLENTNPLVEMPTSTNPLDVFNSLLPQPQQGLESWIWIYTRLLDASAACPSTVNGSMSGAYVAPAPAPAPVPIGPSSGGSGTLVFMWQTTVDPGKPQPAPLGAASLAPASGTPRVTGTASAVPVSTWCLFCGAVEPGTGRWIASPVVYLDDSQLLITPPSGETRASSIQFDSPDVAGFIAQSTTGSVYDIVFKKAPFGLGAVVSSKRGPTYEQSGGNVSRTGPLQVAYWSMVDGEVQNATLTLPSSNAAAAAPATPVTYQFSSGYCWYDYEQIGIDSNALPRSPVVQLLGAAMPTAPATPWLFFTVQSSTMQATGTVKGSEWERLNRGEAAVGSGNVWFPDQAPAYNVPMTVTVASTYAGTNVPSAINVQIAALPGHPSQLLQLVSISKDPTLLMNATGAAGYESPADVKNRPCTYGVIEYFPNRANAQVAIAQGSLPASLKTVSAASPLAVGTLTGAGLLFVLLIIALVLIGVYTPHCRAGTAGSGKPKAAAASTMPPAMGGMFRAGAGRYGGPW